MALQEETTIDILPVIPLKGLVVFPNMMLHFDVGRQKSIDAVKSAMENNQKIFITAQKDVRIEDPGFEDLYPVGVIAHVRQILKLQGEAVRVLVEGEARAELLCFLQQEPFFLCECGKCAEKGRRSKVYVEALLRQARDLFSDYSQQVPKLPPNVILTIASEENPGALADFIASNIMLRVEDKQEILRQLNPVKRLELLASILKTETEVLTIENEINEKVKEQIDENQRDYYLREQLKVLLDELDEGDNPQSEAEAYREQLDKMNLPIDIAQKLGKDIGKLYKMPGNSHEATVLRNYLDTVMSLPWNKQTKDKYDITSAKRVLDKDHYGLDKVKDRILEVLAVKKLTNSVRGQIICMVGPPGVGKTSIARSIARAMGRKFARVSLGGVHDEAEIRGHRKTYIGAMPGRIMQAVAQCGSRNPVILLDEIDKLGSDFRGDPSSALLEVLDSEQNNTFRDHFLEVPFDLSEVLFITTANNADTIPGPLYDRMDVITLSSYTLEEKVQIARRHLLPKQLKACGLTARNVKMPEQTLRAIAEFYTREAGVRTLERKMTTILRQAAKTIAQSPQAIVKVSPDTLEDFLGPQRFKDDYFSKTDDIGIVNGLAWTAAGGEILSVEVAVLEGTGKIELTGSLGDVMKESARAAVSYIRGRCGDFGIEKDFYKNKDLHIHFPEGAVPKDGPSAGVTIVTALVSALTQIKVRHDVAMTGEITLRGRVLPIGGLKEKSMAAYKSGIHTVIIPKNNVPDLADVDEVVRESVTFVPAEHLDTVLKTALCKGRLKPVSSREPETAVRLSHGDGGAVCDIM